MLTPFQYAFVQRGLAEVLLLSVGAGLLGTWIVLRGLAFYSHAVATAAFPGLVVAAGVGFAPPLGALAAAAVFLAGVLSVERRERRGDTASATGLVLVGALALGVILASDVFHSGSNVETLLFGSLLLIGHSDLALAGASSAATLALTFVLGRRWLAKGFDTATAHALGARSAIPDTALYGLVAFAVVSSLAAVGALLAAALFVVPAATVRLVTSRLIPWQVGSVALVAAEGVVGLWVSVQTNTPPGAAVAVVGGAVFAIVAAARAVRSTRALAAAAAVLLLAGCGTGAGSSKGIDVVATTTQIGDWVRVVGGPEVALHQILQPNTDPHEYEPRPKDVETTSRAKLVFENGDGLDAWMAKVVSQSGGHPLVRDLGRDVPIRLARDPHWWHDPRNAESAVRQIGAALAHADPAHAAAYTRRAKAYLARLLRLDKGIAACFARIPAAQRKLVTNHDAFDYFAHRYRITVVGAVIPSQTTQAQPSAGELASLVSLIRREHVKAVFPESSINPRLADTIARETGASARYTLYGDTLGPAGSPGATYLGMERANADAMVRGFTGGASGCEIGGRR